MSKDLLLRKKIKTLIKEMFEQSEEFETNTFNKEKAKEVFLAFVNKKVDKNSVKVQETKKMETGEMIDINDYIKSGQVTQQENPIISFMYEGEKYHFLLEINKEYKYETESGDWNISPYEKSDLINIELPNQVVEISNEDGDNILLREPEIEKSDLQKFEKTLMEFIQ